MISSRDISTMRSHSRYDAPLPHLTLAQEAQKGVTRESLNKRRRLDIKNCSSREKCWLYCAVAGDGTREEENNLPVMPLRGYPRGGTARPRIYISDSWKRRVPHRGRNISALLVARGILSGTKSRTHCAITRSSPPVMVHFAIFDPNLSN